MSIFDEQSILFLDTETTGLWNSKNPATDKSQPHPVQIAIIHSFGKTILAAHSFLVNTNRPCSEEALRVHGKTKELTANFGWEEYSIRRIIDYYAARTTLIVGHNIDFDINILRSYFSNNDYLKYAKRICTMRQSTNVCKLPGKKGYKWPRLEEAYKILVDSNGFQNTHDAMGDINATFKLFWTLVSKGYIV